MRNYVENYVYILYAVLCKFVYIYQLKMSKNIEDGYLFKLSCGNDGAKSDSAHKNDRDSEGNNRVGWFGPVNASGEGVEVQAMGAQHVKYQSRSHVCKNMLHTKQDAKPECCFHVSVLPKIS